MTTQGHNDHDASTTHSGDLGGDADPLDDGIDPEIDGAGGESDNDLPPWTDAGEGEDLAEGRRETQLAVVRLNEAAERAEDAAASVRTEPNLIKRAKALFALNAFVYPNEKVVRAGDQFVMQALPTDSNRWAFFDALFGEEDDRPHVDTFRGRLVDHCGDVIDERYPVLELVGAMEAAGLKGHSADAVRKSFKEWALARQSNDLIKYISKTRPDWDGTPRMETALIELFGCFDTELNREFSRYFWLSLYCRVMHPGCNAPMVLSLFGAQNAGKSYFAKQICQILTGSKESDSVQLDLSGDRTNFLREITGNSIVANVGEMTGFNRGDLNKIKDFITRTGDNMHFKYEGNFIQPRQWITVMDGNKYEGLQRDETGNRRFYPMFVGQLPDVNGQPAWVEEYHADFTGFTEKVWQLFAEAHEWIEAHGMKAYDKFVGVVSKKVAEFSRSEMGRDRGTIRDEALDVFLVMALRVCKVSLLNRTKNKGIWVATGDLARKITQTSSNRCDVKYTHLPPKMALLGAERQMIDNTQGYIWRDVMSYEAFTKRLNRGAANVVAEAIDEQEVDKVIDPGADGEF